MTLFRPLIASLLLALPAHATDEAWPDLKDAIYGDRLLLNGAKVIAMNAPTRTYEDSRTIIGADVTAPKGQLIKKISVILDNNPAPVAVEFTLTNPLNRFAFEVTLRINGPTPMHVTAETETGIVFVTDTFVKTSGQGACSAPPGTDVASALETLGDINIFFEDGTVQLTNKDTLATLVEESLDKKVRIAVDHPSHSGLQMDQISLLFIPMRTIQTLDVDRNEEPFVSVEGSITLSENPELSISVPSDTYQIGVTMTDTDGTVTHQVKSKSLQ